VTDAQFADLMAEQRAQTAELRAIRAAIESKSPESALIAALRAEFTDCRFSAKGLIDEAADCPGGAIANALAPLVDMNGAPHGWAVAVGRILARLPELERVAEHRGVAVYRLRD
jgi:hypothetical protein